MIWAGPAQNVLRGEMTLAKLQKLHPRAVVQGVKGCSAATQVWKPDDHSIPLQHSNWQEGGNPIRSTSSNPSTLGIKQWPGWMDGWTRSQTQRQHHWIPYNRRNAHLWVVTEKETLKLKQRIAAGREHIGVTPLLWFLSVAPPALLQPYTSCHAWSWWAF